MKRQSADKAICANILWNDYWPADARVPRLAPEDFEIGARWTVARPLFKSEFPGMELRVKHIDERAIALERDDFFNVIPLADLPNENYVPSRCVGPQTRWDFPVLKGHMALLLEAYAFGQFADDFDRPLPLTVRAALRKHLDEQLAAQRRAKGGCNG